MQPYQKPNAGSVFIFTFGLLLVMVAIAYSFMISTRIRRDADQGMHMRSYAEIAARQGADHAIAILTTDYLSEPGVPTHPGSLYQTAFASIDTDRVGKHLNSSTNASSYRPVGDPGTWEDENENDTKTESLLSAVYNSVYGGGGTYSYRGDGFKWGKMLTNGLGRYIEPGYYHSDLVNKPVSFHLEHPVAANASSPDPAIRRGEPWVPDRINPMYLDNNLQTVSLRSEARYRLRYAVTIEDLSGHLPMAWQGPYTTGVSSALTSTVTSANADAVSEVDLAIGTQYRDAFFNLFGGSKAWWAYFAAQGQGYTTFTPSTDTNHSLDRYHVFSHVSGGSVYRYHQFSSSSRPDQSTPITYGDVWASGRGPVASAGSARGFIGGAQTAPSLTYTYTPYGREPVVATNPSQWRDSYVNCPWQINLPTAVPEAVTRMVYAYLPREALTFLYSTRKKYKCVGFNADGAASWSLFANDPIAEQSSIGMLDLFASPDFSALFNHLPPTQPYPGSDPSTPGPDWRVDLGKDIDLNTTSFSLMDGANPMPLNKVPPRPPFWGMPVSYLPDLKSEVTELENPVLNGEKWIIYPPSSSMEALTKSEGYWYEDSYYMDLTVALLHAISAAQLAWMPDNGGSWDGDQMAGRATYPANVNVPELLPLMADGQPSGRDSDVIDRDADGDGKAESPSAFDTMREIDAQFVRNMGEYFGPVTSGDPRQPVQGLYVVKINPSTSSTYIYRSRAEYVAWTVSNNIASLLASATPISAGEAGLMELTLNDMRMSFFGASPQYDDFQGIDFDNNGTVRCSAYNGGSCPTDPATRFGRVITPAAGDHRFSLTGCFLMQKSHYFRAFIRGEVFDTLRMVPAESTTLEMVYAMDPEGRIFDVNNQPNPARRDPNGDGNTSDADIRDSQVLFQRWHWIRHQMYRARVNQ